MFLQFTAYLNSLLAAVIVKSAEFLVASFFPIFFALYSSTKLKDTSSEDQPIGWTLPVVESLMRHGGFAASYVESHSRYSQSFYSSSPNGFLFREPPDL